MAAIAAGSAPLSAEMSMTGIYEKAIALAPMSVRSIVPLSSIAASRGLDPFLAPSAAKIRSRANRAAATHLKTYELREP